MKVYYNPLDTSCKSVIGAVKKGQKITFCVYGGCVAVWLKLRKDGESLSQTFRLEKEGDKFFTTITLDQVGLYFYYFDLAYGDYIGSGYLLNGVITHYPKEYELTVYDSRYIVPEWLKGGLIYQIFPDRFNKSGEVLCPKGKKLHENWYDTPDYMPSESGEILNNDFFGGNFKGIEAKLGYLKDLSFTAIYLNPIFKAYSNHRYDTGDYMHVDEMLGSLEDFKSLIKSAEENGIKIILDGVFSHTGSDSVYFNKKGNYDSVGAYNDKGSEYFEWYDFINYPNEYVSWWGINTLPQVNELNEKYLGFIVGKNGVIEKYTSLGIGGWRLDVADELPDEFIIKLREKIKSISKNAVLIGEVWEDATNKISYGKRREYFWGKELDSVMNYPLKDGIINFVTTENSSFLLKVITEQIDHYPKTSLDCLMNVLGTHDTERILTVLKSKEKYKIATLLQYTLYGVPSVYYGDEAGMEGGRDPFNRKCYPWGKEDGQFIKWHKTLGNIRKKIDLFTDGNLNFIYHDRHAIIYERRKGDLAVTIAVNFGKDTLNLNFEGKLYNLLDGREYNGEIELKKQSYGIYYTELI